MTTSRNGSDPSAQPPARGLRRRDWLKLGGATAAGVAGVALAGCDQRNHYAAAAQATPTGTSSNSKPGKPRNVILMISDGMSTGVPTLAELMSPELRNRGTVMAQMLADPDVVRTFIATESANSWVTDSAAAATAMGSGHVADNGTLNVMPVSGEPMVTLADNARQRGKRVGLVTTDRVCGGTPAGFAAVQENRNHYNQIAPQMLDRCDVLLGGGRENFDPLARDDARDLLGAARMSGHKLLMERDHLLAADASDRCLGLFGEGKLPYTLDHRQHIELRRAVPTLGEMTAHALACLQDKGEGFFLMVEAARVDHAAHGNDAAAMLWDQLAFDDAVGTARQFTHDRDDTLLIVTTDHGNGNPGLNGMGRGYADSTEAGKRLAHARTSFERLRDPLREAAHSQTPTASVRSLVRAELGLDFDGHEVDYLLRSMDHDSYPPHELDADRFDRHWFSMLGQAAGNHHGIGWTSTAHTHDVVTFLARGPGAEQYTTARHHVDVSQRMLEGMSG